MTIPSRMPAEDQMLYAHWIPNTNTPYTVQHYLIDPNTETCDFACVYGNLDRNNGHGDSDHLRQVSRI